MGSAFSIFKYKEMNLNQLHKSLEKLETSLLILENHHNAANENKVRKTPDPVTEAAPITGLGNTDFLPL